MGERTELPALVPPSVKVVVENEETESSSMRLPIASGAVLAVAVVAKRVGAAAERDDAAGEAGESARHGKRAGVDKGAAGVVVGAVGQRGGAGAGFGQRPRTARFAEQAVEREGAGGIQHREI